MANFFSDSELTLLNIGLKIKALREEQNLKIKDLAEMTGLSSALISQVEHGHTQPSLETLWKIARSLNVPIGFLFEQTGKEGFAIVKRHERKQLYMPSSNLRYQLLSPDLNRKIEMILIVLEPGQVQEKMTISHEGEECGYVISGQLGIIYGDSEYVLSEGDSVYYDSRIPHRFFNPGEVQSISVWAMTPPSF